MNFSVQVTGTINNNTKEHCIEDSNYKNIKENFVLRNNFFSQNITHLNSSSVLQFNNYNLTKTDGQIRINPKNVESKCEISSGKLPQSNFYTLSNFKEFVRMISESLPYILFMNVCTFFGIFGNSIKFALISPNYDIIFEIFKMISVFFLLLDIFISIFSKDCYLFSFYFWIETISSIGFFFEFDSISEHLQKSSSNLITNNVANKITFNLLSILNAIVAIRTIDILKYLYILKNVNIYKNAIIYRENVEKKNMSKLYKKSLHEENILNKFNPHYNKSYRIKMFLEKNHGKHIKNKVLDNYICVNDMISQKQSHLKIIDNKQKNLSSESYDSPANKLHEQLNEINFDKLKIQSRISYKLSESILKKVIILVSILNIIVPFFDFYWNDNSLSSIYDSLSLIEKYLENNIYLKESIIASFEIFPVLNITYKNKVIYRNNTLSEQMLRYHEIKTVYSSSLSTVICYNNKADVDLNGYLIFFRCLFLSLIIVFSTLRLENDAKEYIIDPLEIMIELVDLVVKNPINAKNLNYLESGNKNNVMKMKYHLELHKLRPLEKQKKQKQDYLYNNYEIKIIKQALMKISALIAIGFGEAGGEIIKNNITFDQKLNPMIKGNKMLGIFGFCIIKDFDLINHALQEKTFILVNLIAEIVHSTVDLYKGAVNKNIGEAFLVVWKFNEINYSKNENSEYLIDPTEPNVNMLADQAILSFLDIYIKINQSKEISEIMNNHKVQESFRKKYSSKKTTVPVKLDIGFGLHLGWAIEGSIGSDYKIDASYLSPHVNLSARLECATNLYGVKFLISGDLYDSLSAKLKKICRRIDIVTVKGSIKPITLFTIDVNSEIKINKIKEKENILMKKFKHEQIKNEYNKWRENFSLTNKVLNTSKFRNLLNFVHSPYFMKCYEEAFELYTEGSWKLASYKFNDCLFLNPKDNVTKILLRFINSCFNQAPKDWKGFRELKTKI